VRTALRTTYDDDVIIETRTKIENTALNISRDWRDTCIFFLSRAN